MASVTFKKDNVDVVDMVLTPSDFVNGVWETDELNTLNATRVTVNARYTSLTPDQASQTVGYRLQAGIYGEDDGGEYEVLCKQFTPTFSSENAEIRRMIVTSGPTAYEPNVQHIIPGPLGNELVEVSVEDDAIPDKVKVLLLLEDFPISGGAPFQSVTLTLRGKVN